MGARGGGKAARKERSGPAASALIRGSRRGLGTAGLPDTRDGHRDVLAHRAFGGCGLPVRDRGDDRRVLVVTGAHVGRVGGNPVQRDAHLVLEHEQDVLQALVAGAQRDRAVQVGVGAEVAGSISAPHGAHLRGQDGTQTRDARVIDALGAQARRTRLQEFADLVDRDQVACLDGRDHDAAARLLDREALGDEGEHGLAHRAARDIQAPRKVRDAKRLAGMQHAAKDGLAQRVLNRVDHADRAGDGRKLVQLPLRRDRRHQPFTRAQRSITTSPRTTS